MMSFIAFIIGLTFGIVLTGITINRYSIECEMSEDDVDEI